MWMAYAAVRLGLSPRVRGSPVSSVVSLGVARSIPACAGEPLDAARLISRLRVYPRVCGGALHECGDGLLLHGLSPRVRGSLDRYFLNLTSRGSIPACAGGAGAGVGPELAACGLSPRVRGSRGGGRRSDRDQGSIPACAGEPLGPDPGAASIRVYPRVCGGAAVPMTLQNLVRGLSPRVRGSPECRGAARCVEGSIPACAGEPLSPPGCDTSAGVYPRVCGGARMIAAPPSSGQGLSPRVRGEPRRCGARNGGSRVYPRVCGGAGLRGCGCAFAPGLSPRVRGSRVVLDG